MVEAAVSAATTPGVTAEQVEKLVAKAVNDAAADQLYGRRGREHRQGGRLRHTNAATATTSACGASSPTAGANAQRGTRARPAVWRIGMPEDITSINIWDILGPKSTAFNFRTLLNRYPFLYGLSDQRLDWVPSLAKGFPTAFVKEGELWTTTVEMKRGAEWSDGTAITADDVVFTIQTALEFELPGNWASIVDPKVIDHAEALDGTTVKFYFKEKPGLARWQFGLSRAQIVAQHFWRPLVEQAKRAGDIPAQQASLFAIVPEDEPTGGEMLFVKWEPGAFVELRANDSYFFKDTTVTEYASGAYIERGPSFTSGPWYGEATGDVALELTRGPHIPVVIFSPYPSQDAAVLALQGDEIDYILTPNGLQRGFQDRLAGDSDITVIANPPNSVRYLGFNFRKAPMDIRAFRQAVATLIDKEFVTATVLQGVADAAYTMVPPGNGFWYNPDVPEIGKGMSREERINAAVALLRNAGFTWDVEPAWDPATIGAVNPEGRGLRMPNGELVPEMTILAPSAGFDPMRSTFAIWIERWLREAGIPVTAQLKGFNVIGPKIFEEQDFDMWILAWNLTVFPGYLNDFFNSERAGPGDNNAGGYSNREFDALGNKLVAETDIEAARDQAARLQELLAEELPYVVLMTTQILEPVRKSVKFPFTSVMDGMQNYFQASNGPLAFTSVE